MEDDAMKGCLILLSLVFAGAVFAGIPASAKQAAAEDKAAAAKKETKWQGNVVRIYKDESQMDIRGTTPAGEKRENPYGNPTQWAKGGEPGQQAEGKGSTVVVVAGQSEDKGGVPVA